MRCLILMVFVFKQKTAYEMRISDWSSDVCSSDLARHAVDAIFLRDADPHALEVAGERRFIIGNGKIERGGILRIETRHFLEQYGAIAHVPGHRTRLIQ